ncbi:hypothetical protein E2C06_16850 [Dankookia rubra]|uniref:Hyalin n=1 Tax=Dankookia rubra TaxID=1442381 RepID=A0A4R5QE26_9PROT|nr:hypothetical protein [Dankookia rubra]TDH61452.1 hypothetical protein E2C06_16850 [Dankookia rubra]
MAQMVFVADDGFSGRELWTTDGTARGTGLLADIWPGGGPGSPTYLARLDAGHAVFAGTDPEHGNEPWITDGTAAGTRLILDISALESGFGGSSPRSFTQLDEGRVLFVAGDAEHGNEPWVTDGTAAGTEVLELVPGSAGGYVSGSFIALGDGRALFAASDPGLGNELWVTDGTQGGTFLVKDLYPGSNGSYPGSSSSRGMISLGDGRAILSAEDNLHGRELWISDGTEAGTSLLADLSPGTISYYPGSGDQPLSSSPGNFTALAPGRILFTATDPEHGTELWFTDGTADGTRLVVDLWPGNAPSYSGANPAANSSNPGQILPLGDGLALVSADDGVHGREFWVTDGSAEGTSLLADIWSGGGSGNPGSATSSYSPYPPYQPQPAVGPGGSIALCKGVALFSATDPVHGTELWITDGTAEGTRMLEDINRGIQGFAGSNPSYFAALGDGRVVFTADDGVNGMEPWITDGTAAGTHLLDNINPGAAGSGAQGYLLL